MSCLTRLTKSNNDETFYDKRIILTNRFTEVSIGKYWVGIRDTKAGGGCLQEIVGNSPIIKWVIAKKTPTKRQ